MIVFVYNNVVVGGAETLLLRQATWASRNSEVCLLCNSISDKMKQSFDENDIKVIICDLHKIDIINKLIYDLEKKGKKIELIEFLDYIQYFKFQFIQLIKKTNIKALYYSVLPTNSNIFSHFRKIEYIDKMICKYSNIFYNTNGIVFMDEDCFNGFNIINSINKKIDDNIVYLPFEVKYKKKVNDSISVLSIARAEFPFKGYLLGLVDSFKKINSKNKYNMTIISYGIHIEELRKKIANDSSITLIGETKPTQLKKYYSKTKVYVGTGTTVLEAASFGIPSIIVAPNTNAFMTNESFDMEGQLDARSNNEDGSKILKEFLEMSKQDYRKLENKTKNMLKKYDSIKNNKKIFNRKIYELNYSIPKTDRYLILLIYYINLFLQKIKRRILVKNVKKKII